MAKTKSLPPVSAAPLPYVMPDNRPKEGGNKFTFIADYHPYGLGAYPVKEGYTAVECMDGLYQILDDKNEKTFFRIGQLIIDKLSFRKTITPQK